MTTPGIIHIYPTRDFDTVQVVTEYVNYSTDPSEVSRDNVFATLSMPSIRKLYADVIYHLAPLG